MKQIWILWTFLPFLQNVLASRSSRSFAWAYVRDLTDCFTVSGCWKIRYYHISLHQNAQEKDTHLIFQRQNEGEEKTFLAVSNWVAGARNLSLLTILFPADCVQNLLLPSLSLSGQNSCYHSASHISPLSSSWFLGKSVLQARKYDTCSHSSLNCWMARCRSETELKLVNNCVRDLQLPKLGATQETRNW